MANRRQLRVGESGKITDEDTTGFSGSQYRRAMTVRMVFGEADNVMKITGGQHDQPIDLLPFHQLPRCRPDTAEVKNIMRGILPGVTVA